jgi:hypothetical protein
MKRGSDMNIDIDNGPSTRGEKFLFCEKHNALALAFLRDATNAVKFAAIDDARKLQAEVNKSVVLFLWSRQGCEDCAEVQFGQESKVEP